MDPKEITVIVHGARNLQGRKKGKSKFSVIFGLGDKKFRTQVVKEPLGNPDWMEESTIAVRHPGQTLNLVVTEKDDVLGQVSLPVNCIGAEVQRWKKKYPLQPHKKCAKPQGELLLEVWVSKYHIKTDKTIEQKSIKSINPTIVITSSENQETEKDIKASENGNLKSEFAENWATKSSNENSPGKWEILSKISPGLGRKFSIPGTSSVEKRHNLSQSHETLAVASSSLGVRRSSAPNANESGNLKDTCINTSRSQEVLPGISPLLGKKLHVRKKSLSEIGLGIVAAAKRRNSSALETLKSFADIYKPKSEQWSETVKKDLNLNKHDENYDSSTCPQITGITPDNGTIIGGTRVTITGKNLGKNKEDVVGLFICGSNCLKYLEYESSTKLYVTTKPWKPCSGVLTMETQSGGRTASSVKFTFTEPPPCGDEKHEIFLDEDLNIRSRTPSTSTEGTTENKKGGFFSRLSGSPDHRRKSSCSHIEEDSVESLLLEIKTLKEENRALKEENLTMKQYIDHLVARVMEECPEKLASNS